MQNNPWQYKPWWCQPWSILLTGTSLIVSTAWLGHRLWLTLLVAAPVTVWMGFFVLIWPRLMRQSGLLAQWAAEQPVDASTSGDEPTSTRPEP